MINLRRFFHQAVAHPEPDAVSGDNLLVFTNSEKNSRDSIGYVPLPHPSRWRARYRAPPFIIKLLFLTSAIVLAFFFGQSITSYAALAYQAILHGGKPAADHGVHTPLCAPKEASVDKPIPVAAPPPPNVVPPLSNEPISVAAAPPWGVIVQPPEGAKLAARNGWEVKCSSAENNFGCGRAIDAEGAATDWKSKADSGGHWIIIDLKQEVSITSLAVKPSKDWQKEGSSVRKHRVEVRRNNEDWVLVAFGSWRDGFDEEKYATFEPRAAQLVRLTIVDSHRNKFVAISDINIYSVEQIPRAVPKGGRWNVTLDFPMVPVTAFLDPLHNKLIAMSSWERDHWWSPSPQSTTVTAIWDPSTQLIVEDNLMNAGHDMFCPGTSYDERGRVIVTGGSTPKNFSIYDPALQKWIKPDGWSMQIAKERGYQGQTYLPDGRTFMIGGAWSGGDGNKDGEIFDPNTGKWTLMPNISAEHIKMDVVRTCNPQRVGDANCVMTAWQQHHPWLFAWRNQSIFHAGPSKKMHWFFTNSTNGSVVEAGVRAENSTEVQFADGDAVCGVAVMYDAKAGHILTAGGAPNYHYWFVGNDAPFSRSRSEATTNAFRITIGEPGSLVKPVQIAPMMYKRIFAGGIVLPTGEVMVVGGQARGEPYHDETWQAVPELYSPKDQTWRPLANHSIPRAYHSWAMLLPDATVIVGGSGLEKGPTNHFDAQIYQPYYLFTPDGSKTVDRPKLTADETRNYTVGENITLTTDVEVNDACLIRYSAATHALNNDLRRIPLKPVSVGNPSDKKYTVEIPDDAGIALPGYWMLFVLNKGVPSVSRTVRILAKRK